MFQRRSYTDLHNGLLGLFLAQSLVLIVTDSIKVLFFILLPQLKTMVLDRKAEGLEELRGER